MDLQITPHRFRHTHCSLLFEIGASIKETGDRVAKFMGMELKCTQKRIQNNFRQKEKAQNADLTMFWALILWLSHWPFHSIYGVSVGSLSFILLATIDFITNS